MNKKIFNMLLSGVLVLAFVSLGFRGADEKQKLNKPNKNDDYKYIAVNQILMWVGNNGLGSHDPRNDQSGLYWPGGLNATKTAIFQDGLIFGARLGNEVRVNGNTHRSGLQAGKMLSNGKPDPDVANPRYRVYKIRKDFATLPVGTTRDALEKDWKEWPIIDGAPWIDANKNGIYEPNVADPMSPSADRPDIIGDEMLWYVANDGDPTRSTFTYGGNPMGLEFQTTIFGFNRTGPLGNMVFKKYLMINKGPNILNDMYVAYWSDPDLGDANDDFVGCDTTLKLGYCYNGDNDDQIYGTPPPAAGYVFFQGPKIPYDKVLYPIIDQKSLPDSAKFKGKWIKNATNLPMTAFAFYINPDNTYKDPTQGQIIGSQEFYNYLQGRVWNGNAFTDPNTNQPVTICLAGDPVKGTGWYEGKGWPGGKPAADRRLMMASGPFQLNPGDTQEVVVGIVIAQGTSNLNSVTELKTATVLAQTAFNVDFNLPQAPPTPVVHVLPQNESVTLWWETNAETSSEKNTIISPTAPDKFYKFQGYRLWQLKDEIGSEPKLLYTWDIQDSVTVVEDIVDVNGVKVQAPIFTLENKGLKRTVTLNTNAYTNGPLYNGTPYYFAVTSFSCNKFSIPNSPEFLERPPVPIEVRPTTMKVDLSINTDYDFLKTKSTENNSANTGLGEASITIIDPLVITGDAYKITIDSVQGRDLYYSVKNTTKNKTLASMVKVQADSLKLNNIITDGFVVSVLNKGQDTLNTIFTTTSAYNGIREVLETKNGSGNVNPPVNVLNRPNKTNKWKIESIGQQKAAYIPPKDHRFSLNWSNVIGSDEYEIRFTATGSQYYVTGVKWNALTPEFKSDVKGAGTVPFEVWKIDPFTKAETRMMIKIYDYVKDTAWTFLDSTKTMEDILVYQSKTPYPADGNLPAKSEVTVKADHRFGFMRIATTGTTKAIPEVGTVIKLTTFRPLGKGDAFNISTVAPNLNDKTSAKDKLEEISVYPNPYFGANILERSKYERFVRFTNLPTEVNVKIFSISGQFINELKKNSQTSWLDWNLLTKDLLPIPSGIYIAYIEMPGIGTKVMKIAVIMETQYIDRL